MIELSAGKLAADEKSIGQFEFVNRLELPADYRAFLLKTNGGTVEGDWIFDISKEEGATFLRWFLRAADVRRSTNTLAYYQELCGWRLPKNLIVIAADGFSNKVCLGVRGAELGKVYFWNIQKEYAETAPGSFENFSEIAPSFSRFLEMLRPDETPLD